MFGQIYKKYNNMGKAKLTNTELTIKKINKTFLVLLKSNVHNDTGALKRSLKSKISKKLKISIQFLFYGKYPKNWNGNKTPSMLLKSNTKKYSKNLKDALIKDIKIKLINKK